MKYRLLALLLAMTLLSGCAYRIDPPIPTEAPTEAPTDAPTEPTQPTEPAEPAHWEQVTTNVIRGMEKSDFFKGKSGDYTFFFDCASWDEASADEAVSHILTYLDAIGKLVELTPGTICVGSNMVPTRRADFAYLPYGKDDALSAYDYFTLIPVFCREELDYGLAYGRFALICEELSLCNDIQPISDAELAEYFSDEDNSYQLDLTLPLLDGIWTDEKAAGYARSAAVSLARHSKPADLHFPVEAAGTARAAWLTSIGAACDYEPFAYLPFIANFNNKAADYPYVSNGEEANWFFRTENVQDAGFVPFITDFFSVAKYITYDFRDAQQVLSGYIAEDIPPVEVYTSFQTTGNTGAIFSKSLGIVLYHGWSTAAYAILHEYIHYLLPDIVKANRCMNEALTEALAAYYCDNYCRQNCYLNDPNIYADFDQMGLIYDDGTLDLATYTDLEAYFYASREPGGDPYLNISGDYAPRPEKLTFTRLSYAEGASMANYMLDIYGWDEVLTHSSSWDDVEELWGTDFGTLYADWKQANIDFLSQYYRLS